MASELVQALVKTVQWKLWSPVYTRGFDPISTCIRCALLKFKPVGTKLSFRGPTIDFDAPIRLQSRVRELKLTSRSELSQLQLPLANISKWYNVHDPQIQLLVRMSREGLEVLRQSYSSGSTQNQGMKSSPTDITLSSTFVNTNAPPLVCPAIELFIQSLPSITTTASTSLSSDEQHEPFVQEIGNSHNNVGVNAITESETKETKELFLSPESGSKSSKKSKKQKHLMENHSNDSLYLSASPTPPVLDFTQEHSSHTQTQLPLAKPSIPTDCIPPHFRVLWSKCLLTSVCQLLMELDSKSSQIQDPVVSESIMNSIESILKSRDHILLSHT